jgi:hypothetical protein
VSGIAGRGRRAHAHAGSSRGELVREYEGREPNSLQLARLADLAGVSLADVEHKSIATLKDELAIDAILFQFEQVCGQVVKVDPATGLKYPVAGATVTVNDLECDWLWFFPPGWPWSWGYRLPRCSSVPIGSVQTGPCGEFCILIPRWDIEWIRLWLQERRCFPEILNRPTVAGLLAPHLPPNPPDPASLAGLLAAREDLAAAIGPAAVGAIRDAGRSQTVGSLTTGLSDVLAGNAFTRPVPAPVPAELRALSPAKAMESLASRVGLRSAEGELDLAAPFGPFLRCVDVEVPIWIPFYSVPDINFVVTQDVGNAEQVIYDGAFDAHWDTWPAPLNVELDVVQSAVASPIPGCPPQGIECTDEPAIVSIGLLDVNPVDGYLDPGSGFATMMNQPVPAPLTSTPSTAPFESVISGYLPLYGCVAGAEFYRVMARYADSDGLTSVETDGSMTPLPSTAFGPAAPVIAPVPWHVAPLSGPVSPAIVPDADGWYQSTYLDYYPQNLLVNWDPPDGVYQLTIETGTGSPGSVTQTGGNTTPVVVVVDNTPPSVTFQPVGWNYTGSAASPTPLTPDNGCFIIERSSQDIEVQLSYTVTAYHLYSVCLVADGCDAGGVTVTDSGGLTAGTAACLDGLGYVYDGPFDNSLPDSTLTGTVTYTIPGDSPDGCYSWNLTAYSRAFSPNASQGLDDTDGSSWNYTQTPIYSNPSVSIAIVTE